jgi:hypothetical protein
MRVTPFFIQSKLTLFLLVVKGIGFVLLLLSILGVFKHHDRIEFYETLQMEKELPADLPVARELMKERGVPDEQIILIKKILIRDLRFGRMGRSIGGTVVAEATPDERRTLGDLVEFREWAYSKSKAYEWIGFVLVAAGFTIDIIIYFRESALLRWLRD